MHQARVIEQQYKILPSHQTSNVASRKPSLSLQSTPTKDVETPMPAVEVETTTMTPGDTPAQPTLSAKEPTSKEPSWPKDLRETIQRLEKEVKLLKDRPTASV